MILVGSQRPKNIPVINGLTQNLLIEIHIDYMFVNAILLYTATQRLITVETCSGVWILINNYCDKWLIIGVQ
jgi:hypothetical protein